MARVLVPIPRHDFDPTETAVPWHVITSAGHHVIFATFDGAVGAADERMLDGRGLGPFKKKFSAREDAVAHYRKMAASPEFTTPILWQDIRPIDFDALLLPGGHAPRMKEYLESEILQQITWQFVEQKRLLAAICHGVVLAARAKSPSTGQSVLYGKQTTALPRWMELSAWAVTGLWLGSYYRTYPQTVQAEVTAALKHPTDFVVGPHGSRRDSLEDLSTGFIVEDEHYISARWPGDAYQFSTRICERLRGH